MAIYPTEVAAMGMRAVEALDRGMTITFEDLRNRVIDGELQQVLDVAGIGPIPPVPDADFNEVSHAVGECLRESLGQEATRFFVSRNGYCLLIGILREVERSHAHAGNRPKPALPTVASVLNEEEEAVMESGPS